MKNPKVNTLSEFLEGRSKILDIVVEREDKDSWTLLHFRDRDTGIELFTKWQRKDSIFETKKEKDNENYGGADPYVMMHTKSIKKVFLGEYVGNMDCQLSAMTILSEFIQSGTGKIVKPRTKEAMKRKDIARELGVSERRAAGIIGDLKNNGLIERREDAYYVPRKFYAKGKARRCDTTSKIRK